MVEFDAALKSFFALAASLIVLRRAGQWKGWGEGPAPFKLPWETCESYRSLLLTPVSKIALDPDLTGFL